MVELLCTISISLGLVYAVLSLNTTCSVGVLQGPSSRLCTPMHYFNYGTPYVRPHSQSTSIQSGSLDYPSVWYHRYLYMVVPSLSALRAGQTTPRGLGIPIRILHSMYSIGSTLKIAHCFPCMYLCKLKRKLLSFIADCCYIRY